jgi:hypothetical protein
MTAPPDKDGTDQNYKKQTRRRLGAAEITFAMMVVSGSILSAVWSVAVLWGVWHLLSSW